MTRLFLILVVICLVLLFIMGCDIQDMQSDSNLPAGVFITGNNTFGETIVEGKIKNTDWDKFSSRTGTGTGYQEGNYTIFWAVLYDGNSLIEKQQRKIKGR